ncbi:MAG: pitrilysin family protein [Patescibacteria group bacterium]
MKFTKKTLSNGLRVISAPMHGTDTVTLLVLVGTGSNYESQKINGLSHFLEHMFFKGTKNYPKPGELDRMLDAVGAIHNAFTSREETGYWVKVDAKHFPLALNFVSDILQNALLKEEEINRERGPVLEEMSMIWDDPMRYIWSVFERLVYGDNPYGWDVIGTQKNIREMKRSDFLKYWKSQYVASNTIVVAAGNIPEGGLFEKIEKAFGNLREGRFAKAPEPKKLIEGPRIETLLKDTAQTHVMVGVGGYELTHKDRIVAEVLSTILGGYMSSRLFSDIRERHGLAYAVRASHQSYRKVGYFAAYAGTPHTKAEEVVRRIVANLTKIKKSGVSTEELMRAKENIKGRLAISLESTDDVASYLGEQEILLGKIETPDVIIKKLERITKEDIVRVAKKIFTARNVYTTLIGPNIKEDSYKKILQTI